MATLTSGYSLVEQAKRVDPEGKLQLITEALDVEMGMILQEAPWLPSNDVWVNNTLRRASLPSGTWRVLNEGVSNETSRTTEVLDVIGMLETYAKYDKDYIDSLPSGTMSRMMEAQAFLEGLGQTLVSAIFYENSLTNPKRMHGLHARLASTDGEFCIDGGGSGSDTTSVNVITWGPTMAHLIYPKNDPNGTLGIRHEDLGEDTLTDSNNNEYQGYRDHFQVKCGFVVRHPKCIGRVANVETSGAANTFNPNDLITLLNNMKTGPGTRIYINQTIKTQAEIALLEKGNVHWTEERGLDGIPFLKFRGIPVRMIDRDILLDTETAI